MAAQAQPLSGLSLSPVQANEFPPEFSLGKSSPSAQSVLSSSPNGAVSMLDAPYVKARRKEAAQNQALREAAEALLAMKVHEDAGRKALAKHRQDGAR